MDNNIPELVKILETGDGGRVISARELHHFLEIKQDFSSWIKSRIERYNLVQNVDYLLLYYNYLGDFLNIQYGNVATSGEQRVSKIDYILSMDTAKELAMMESNAKGAEVRKYFIACDRIANQKLQQMSPTEQLLYFAQLLVEKNHKVSVRHRKQ